MGTLSSVTSSTTGALKGVGEKTGSLFSGLGGLTSKLGEVKNTAAFQSVGAAIGSVKVRADCVL